jgi:hypothetical protein
MDKNRPYPMAAVGGHLMPIPPEPDSAKGEADELERVAVKELEDELAALKAGGDEQQRSDQWDAFEAGYMQGHNDMVESCVRDSKEAASDYFEFKKPAPSVEPGALREALLKLEDEVCAVGTYHEALALIRAALGKEGA